MTIIARNLCKNFKSYKKAPGVKGSLKYFFQRTPTIKTAVKDFNLSIKKGEIVGLLGPNGAGKTTLMKMFTGIIVPTSGDLNILGHRPSERQKDYRKKIALVMGQKSQLWWDLPAMDSLHLLQKFYEIAPHDFKYRVTYFSELLDLGDKMHIHVRKLSLGERMKLELMASLLHRPEIIFLDEPTIGLDVVAQERIRHFISEYQQEHEATIILTSHYMADIQALCPRIVLILDGEKSFDDSTEKFATLFGHKTMLSIHFTQPLSEEDSLLKKGQWNEQRDELLLDIQEEEISPFLCEITQRYQISKINTSKASIEDVMKQILTKGPGSLHV